jgi:hypothetical protein
MIDTFKLLAGAILRLFHCRRRLLLENLALRQQLAVLKRRHPRPRLSAFDKFFWVLARRFWSGWKQTLIVVDPETVVRWHRSGFALYPRVISRARRVTGRRRISKEVRDLIFRMVTENPTWGAPRIHGELLSSHPLPPSLSPGVPRRQSLPLIRPRLPPTSAFPQALAAIPSNISMTIRGEP